jgi:adenylate cyclase
MNDGKAGAVGRAEANGAPDEEAIRAYVERVISSAQFRSSERIRQFLRYVVDETLAGRADVIKAYSIAVDCFDREADFDPQLDPYVRIVARRLRRALKHYYEDEGAGDEIRISVPRGSYVPEFARFDGDPAAAPRPRRALPAARLDGKPATASVVAVVRMEAHGDETDHEFLASGLTQEIILDLSRFDKLRVVGPITAAVQDAQDSSPRDIGRGHEADFVLMGAVHNLAGNLRITVSLTEVASSRMIWAERFEPDSTVHDLFAVQDDIASTVAATIGDAAGVIVRRVAERTRGREPADLTSYEAVLRGHHWGNVATAEALSDAHEALENAVAAEPGYAMARALLSDIYFTDWTTGVDRFSHALGRAEQLAVEAVEIDPFCSDARWVLAQAHYGHRRFDDFRNQFEAALELNPYNPSHLASYALFLVGLEEWDEARGFYAAATRLHPQHPPWYHLVPTMIHARRGEWPQAMDAAEEVRTPGLFWGSALRAMVLGHQGAIGAAAACIYELVGARPDFAQRGRELMERLLCAEGNVAVVVDGLRKAGLEID